MMFYRLLKAKIEEVISVNTGSVAAGQAADYATYREQVGYIRGLQDALKLGDETEADLSSKET